MSGSGSARDPGPEAPGKQQPGTDRDVGQALRSVYAKTVNEDIPAELLDLLGKLG